MLGRWIVGDSARYNQSRDDRSNVRAVDVRGDDRFERDVRPENCLSVDVVRDADDALRLRVLDCPDQGAVRSHEPKGSGFGDNEKFVWNYWGRR